MTTPDCDVGQGTRYNMHPKMNVLPGEGRKIARPRGGGADNPPPLISVHVKAKNTKFGE